MAASTRFGRFGKPNLTGLPKDLGLRIFKAILSTPPPDFEKMDWEADELERQMKIELEKHANDYK
ncbi:MAG: hypothetical protein IJ661_06180 [Lachnospiraceae bacterium]|nr:hypothetical protein [Lachnospiraceae bacterium]